MKVPYKDNLPIVKIRIVGQGSLEIDSPVDFASSKTIIPDRVVEELKLDFAVFDVAATAGGVISMSTYKARVQVFGRNFDLLVGSLDLPSDTPITSLLGRDILDEFKVCLDG